MECLHLRIAVFLWLHHLTTCFNLEIGYDVANQAEDIAAGQRGSECERITIPMCLDIGYNMTRMPNIMLYQSQGEAQANLNEFAALVEYGCDMHLRFVLCSLYVPMCTDKVSSTVPACRPMCEQARRRGSPVMEKFSFAWPDSLDCAKLPLRTGPESLCMEAPEDERGPEGRLGTGMLSLPPRVEPARPAPQEEPARVRPAGELLCENPDKFRYVAKSGSCAPRCSPGLDVLWSRRDKDLALIWMAVWSSLCFLSTAFTVLTFLLDPRRFRYPEKATVFLGACYHVYSVAFLVRLAAGAGGVACGRDPRGEPYLIGEDGVEWTGCTAVFFLLYYFGMAGSVWWVVLTLAWFLAAAKRWEHEAIEARSGYFHAAAWGVPAVKTAAVLAARKVAGDELTGLCYVGGADAGALTGFVLVPLCAYLAAGAAFVAAGLAALFGTREAAKTGGAADAEKPERLAGKIGVFSVVYAVPAACVITCLFYERLNADSWRVSAAGSTCAPSPRHGGEEERPCTLESSVPAGWVFLLKIFMSLAVGITSGVWVWSAETLRAWRSVCNRKGGTWNRKQLGHRGRSSSSSSPQCHCEPPPAVVGVGVGVHKTLSRSDNPASQLMFC